MIKPTKPIAPNKFLYEEIYTLTYVISNWLLAKGPHKVSDIKKVRDTICKDISDDNLIIEFKTKVITGDNRPLTYHDLIIFYLKKTNPSFKDEYKKYKTDLKEYKKSLDKYKLKLKNKLNSKK